MTSTATVLTAVYEVFAQWCDSRLWACRKGCSQCCTQNVTITSLEGWNILSYVRTEGREEWLTATLAAELRPQRPLYTINTMARACLAGKELAEEEQQATAPCPFLSEGSCAVYPARPFACRSFFSQKRCSTTQVALVPPEHLAAVTAISQLIEHLDQNQPWGNMLDVLPLLQNGPEDRIRDQLQPLRSRPLPGFMLSADEHRAVAPLLEQLFAARVGERTVEDILNGR